MWNELKQFITQSLLILFFFLQLFFLGFIYRFNKRDGNNMIIKQIKKISQNRTYWVRTVTTLSTHFRFCCRIFVCIYTCVFKCCSVLSYPVFSCSTFFYFPFSLFLLFFCVAFLFNLFSHSWIIFSLPNPHYEISSVSKFKVNWVKRVKRYF